MQLPTCIAIVGMDVLLIKFLIMFAVAMYQSSYRVSTFGGSKLVRFLAKIGDSTYSKEIVVFNRELVSTVLRVYF